MFKPNRSSGGSPMVFQLASTGTVHNPGNSWQRAEFIEKGGWDKMPGQEKADYAVARACADGLDLLINK
ncbi:MAG TPA: hypothetical protein VMU04_12065 [Candidatus Acidoferrum sp.]|nr:hypothetical protein [Candidatus Acidoferrum sp.]